MWPAKLLSSQPPPIQNIAGCTLWYYPAIFYLYDRTNLLPFKVKSEKWKLKSKVRFARVLWIRIADTTLITFHLSPFTFQLVRGAGIIFNTRDINTVIAKNCKHNRADTHLVSVQFCGNLPLFDILTNTQECNPPRSITAVDPHVGA